MTVEGRLSTCNDKCTYIIFYKTINLTHFYSCQFLRHSLPYQSCRVYNLNFQPINEEIVFTAYLKRIYLVKFEPSILTNQSFIPTNSQIRAKHPPKTHVTQKATSCQRLHFYRETQNAAAAGLNEIEILNPP